MQPSGQGYSKSQYQHITIYVTSPLLDNVKGCYTYLVSGNDQYGSIQIRRRYNDFYYLRQSLRKKWPGQYIAPVPQKMITGNKDQGNIQMRKRYFQYFLQSISTNSHLINCSITQQFLRNKSIDMQKFYTTFTYPKPEQSIKQYKNIFNEIIKIQQQKQNATIQQKKVITDFGLYLKKAEKQLKNMRSTIQLIIESRNVFMNNLNTVTSSTLPQYEKNVYSEYLPTQTKQQMLFASRPKVQQNVHKLKQVTQQNSFESCLDMIGYQVLQVQAMQQLLSDRDNFEGYYHKCNEKLLSAQSQLTKLMGGKTTLKSFFSKGNKQQQIKNLQRQVPMMKQQVENWRRLVNLITILIAQRQIPRFKKYKQLKYYDVMHSTSQKQLNYLVVYGDLMKSLMQGIVQVK